MSRNEENLWHLEEDYARAVENKEYGRAEELKFCLGIARRAFARAITICMQWCLRRG